MFDWIDSLSDAQFAALCFIALVCLFLLANWIDTKRVKRNAAHRAAKRAAVFAADHPGRHPLAERDPSPPRQDLEGTPTVRSRRR